jgi:hypothetical protein
MLQQDAWPTDRRGWPLHSNAGFEESLPAICLAGGSLE